MKAFDRTKIVRYVSERESEILSQQIRYPTKVPPIQAFAGADWFAFSAWHAICYGSAVENEKSGDPAVNGALIFLMPIPAWSFCLIFANVAGVLPSPA